MLGLKPVFELPHHISHQIWCIFYSDTDLSILHPASYSFPRRTLVGWGGCEVVERWMRGLCEERFADCHLLMGALLSLLGLCRELADCFWTQRGILSKGASLEVYTDAPDIGGGSDLNKELSQFLILIEVVWCLRFVHKFSTYVEEKIETNIFGNSSQRPAGHHWTMNIHYNRYPQELFHLFQSDGRHLWC